MWFWSSGGWTGMDWSCLCGKDGCGYTKLLVWVARGPYRGQRPLMGIKALLDAGADVIKVAELSAYRAIH